MATWLGSVTDNSAAIVTLLRATTVCLTTPASLEHRTDDCRGAELRALVVFTQSERLQRYCQMIDEKDRLEEDEYK
jgi:hypothetical protein